MGLIFEEDDEERRKLKDNIKKKGKNIQWLYNNLDKLREKYGGNYVLIKNKKIIDNDKSYKRLLKRVKKREDMDQYLIHYIDKEPIIHLL
jgi:uncharacterized protein with gpF-like domain